MKKTFVLLFILLISFKSFACSCECDGDCSFSRISKGSEFVALVKVVEYTDFIEREITSYDGKMPLSMTVEVVEKYFGSEQRKRIKIWGDNGALCRPYIANFEVGKYYLIAPWIINETSENGAKGDYDFFSCFTDYLTVDYENKIAYGEYSKKENQVSLKDFRNEIRTVNFKKSKWFTNNENINFFKADSITLYKILNKDDDFLELNSIYVKSKQNNNRNFTDLEFKRNGKLKIIDTHIENWSETEHLGKWKWEFIDEKSILNVYLDGKLFSSFVLVSQERDNLIWNDDKKVQFYVLNLKRVRK